MLRLTDSVVLAATKLRVHKVRTALATVSVVLFLTLILTSGILLDGTWNAVRSFSDRGLSTRYFLNLQTIDTSMAGAGGEAAAVDPVSQKAAELYAARYPALKKEAAEKGFAEPTKPQTDGKAAGGVTFKEQDRRKAEEELSKGFTTGAVVDAIKQKTQAKGVYPLAGGKSTALNATSQIASWRMPQKTIEVGDADKNNSQNANAPYANLRSEQDTLSSYDQAILKSIAYQGASLEADASGALPVVIPERVARDMMDVRIDKKAPKDTQLDTIRKLRKNVVGKTFSVCVMNANAKKLIEETKTARADYEKRKNDPGYTKPEMLYKLSPDYCGIPTVEYDNRSDAAKNEAAFTAKSVEGETAPASQVLTLKVAGVMSDPGTGDGSFSLKSIVESQSIRGLAVPSQALAKVLNPQFAPTNYDKKFLATYVAEYNDRTAQKAAQATLECNAMTAMLESGEAMTNALRQCQKDGKYTVMSFGSPLNQLEDMKNTIVGILTWIVGILGLVAGLMIFSMVAKAVSDGKKEMAVYRALGAKRHEVAQIYFTFAMFIIVGAFVLALLLSLAISFYVHTQYADKLLLELADWFSYYENTPSVNLVAINLGVLSAALAASIGVAILGSVFPIIGAVRRHPINALRDE